MVLNGQKVWMDEQMEGRNVRMSDTKTLSLRLRQRITNVVMLGVLTLKAPITTAADDKF